MEDFVASAALLAAHLTQQCDRAAADQRAAAAALEEAAANVMNHVDSGREAVRRSTAAAVRETLSGQLDATTARADAAAQRLDRLVAQLDRAQTGLGARARMLGGGTLFALLLGAFAVVGASAYVTTLNLERADRARMHADVLEALQHVSITACDGRPCIKLEDGLPRWSGNPEYVYVDAAQGPSR